MDIFDYSSPSTSPVGNGYHMPSALADRRPVEQHHRHTDSGIFSTPTPTPPGSPTRPASSRSPHLRFNSGSHSTLPVRATATTTLSTAAAANTSINHPRPLPRCGSSRALVTPWERSPIHPPSSVGSSEASVSGMDIPGPSGGLSMSSSLASFALSSLSRSPSRTHHRDRPDQPSRPRTMSPAALVAQPTLSPSNTLLGAAFARASSISKSHHSWRGAGAARPPPASAFTTRPPGMATQMPVLARRNARIGYTKWSPRWIVIDHVDGVLHVYKDPHALVPTDSIQVSSSHTSIQYAIDRNTGLQMLKVYYLSSRYRFRTDPNVIHAWNDTVPDLAMRPGTSPSNLNLLLDALQRSASAPDRAPVWIPARASSTGPDFTSSHQASNSMPNSYTNSSSSSDSESSTKEVIEFDAPMGPESWSAPSTLSRNCSVSTRKAPPPLVLRPMSTSTVMRRPASAPLLSPASAAAAAAAAPSTASSHGLPMPSPWHRETASAGFVFSPHASSEVYDCATSEPYSVSSTRSSTGSKYMDELLFLDPYFQAQKHYRISHHPVAQAAEGQMHHGSFSGSTLSNPFAD